MSRSGVPARAALLAAASLALWPAAARGAEVREHEGRRYALVPEARWGKLGDQDLGKLLCVEGRWQQVWMDGVVLYQGVGGSAPETRKFIRVRLGGPLATNLAYGKDSEGRPLKKQHSMVRIFGKGAATPEGVVVLSVDYVLRLDDEDRLFLGRLAGLQGDAEAIGALAAECRERAQRFADPALTRALRVIVRAELQARAKRLSARDHEARLDLAGRYREELNEPQDAEAAIGLCAPVEGDKDAPDGLRARALELLRQLGAVKTKGRWVPGSVFRKEIGVIQREGRLIRRELAELLDARERELDRQKVAVGLPRTDPARCEKDMRAKRITRGQTYVEVYRATGTAGVGALPVAVYHMQGRYVDSIPNATWTQWILNDGRRVYFVEGMVIEVVPANQGWPEK